MFLCCYYDIINKSFVKNLNSYLYFYYDDLPNTNYFSSMGSIVYMSMV